MLDTQTTRALAEELHAARLQRRPMPSVADRLPQLQLTDAYAISTQWAALQRSQGRGQAGYKIGLTSDAAMQRNALVAPIWGHLFADTIDSGTVLRLGDYLAPRIEVELACVLQALPGGRPLDMADLSACTRQVVPAIEIVDTRITRSVSDPGSGRPILDVVADNGTGGGVLLGPRSFAPSDIDMQNIPCTLYRNGVPAGHGDATMVLGHPLRALHWLAQELATRCGGLVDGDLIMTGSFFAAIDIAAGDHIRADFGPLGQIAFRVVP